MWRKSISGRSVKIGIDDCDIVDAASKFGVVGDVRWRRTGPNGCGAFDLWLCSYMASHSFSSSRKSAGSTGTLFFAETARLQKRRQRLCVSKCASIAVMEGQLRRLLLYVRSKIESR